jgi:hypothetical protein
MSTTLETLKSKQRQAKPQNYGKKTKFVSTQIVSQYPNISIPAALKSKAEIEGPSRFGVGR